METIDFNLQKGGVSASRTKHFNFVNPGPLPDEMTYVPGFVMDLTDNTMCSSHSPNRTLASKLALIYAISGNPFSPRITVGAVEWAVQFAAYVVKWMLYEAQFHLAEGRFGKLMERAKSVISKRGGSIERRDLLRALHCDEATLKRLVKALLIAEEIEAPSMVEGKITYTLSE